MNTEWKPIEGADVLSPLDLNNIPLSSELHTQIPAPTNADSIPSASSQDSHPIKKTSLSNL